MLLRNRAFLQWQYDKIPHLLNPRTIEPDLPTVGSQSKVRRQDSQKALGCFQVSSDELGSTRFSVLAQ